MLFSILPCLVLTWLEVVSTELEGNEICHSFYQDLTTDINKIINGHNDSNNIKLSLETDLQRSTNVYYSTDMLINNITEIIQIINSLYPLKPETSDLLYMLSLRYTSENRFSMKRYNDIYYDLNLNISTESWKFIASHISHIVLDYSTKNCSEDGQYKYTKWEQQHLKYSFPWYIKNFISYYCADNTQQNYNNPPPECNIPVGLAYNFIQIQCGNIFKDKINEADFYIISLHFDLHSGVELTSLNVTNKITSAQKRMQDIFQINSVGPKPVYFKLEIKNVTVPQKLDFSDLIHRLTNLSTSFNYFTQTRLDLVEEIYRNNVELLLNVSRDFEIYESVAHEQHHGFILGHTIVGQISQNIPDQAILDSSFLKPGVVISRIKTNEYEAFPCILLDYLTKSGAGRIAVDQDTWRAIARYEALFKHCKSSDYESLPENKIILVFEKDIWKSWKTVESIMDRLIDKSRKVGNSSLNTIVFHEIEVNFSQYPAHPAMGYEAEGDQIARFMKKWDTEFMTGCVVDFNDERLADVLNKFYWDDMNRDVLTGFCPPVFDIVDLMIWQIPYDDSNWNGLPSKHAAIFAIKDMLLETFPDITVYVQFKNWMSNDKLAEFASFYGIDVIEEIKN